MIISFDDFYPNKEQQIRINDFCIFDHPGAINCELLIQNIRELRAKGSSLITCYSFKDSG